MFNNPFVYADIQKSDSILSSYISDSIYKSEIKDGVKYYHPGDTTGYYQILSQGDCDGYTIRGYNKNDKEVDSNYYGNREEAIAQMKLQGMTQPEVISPEQQLKKEVKSYISTIKECISWGKNDLKWMDRNIDLAKKQKDEKLAYQKAVLNETVDEAIKQKYESFYALVNAEVDKDIEHLIHRKEKKEQMIKDGEKLISELNKLI